MALAIFISSAMICTAEPTIPKGYNLSYDFTAIPHPMTYDNTPSGLPEHQDTIATSSGGSPPAEDYSVEEPPAMIPATSPVNEPHDKSTTKLNATALAQNSAGLAYYPGSLTGPEFELESWDGNSWTKNPIALPMGSMWWWRLTNPDTQSVFSRLNNDPWKPFGLLSPQMKIGFTQLKKCGWNSLKAWGSQDGFSNKIFCYAVCSLKIKILPPGYQGPSPKSVAISYMVNQDCTVQFIVNMPDGPLIGIPSSVSSGSNTYSYFDSGISEKREVIGFAWTSSDSDADKQEFTV